MEKYDLIVIGAGPGGYIGAIRGAQLGLKVAIIDKNKTLGGTCLNWGCIPSKALLDSSEHYHQAKESFKEHGIDVNGIKLNFKQMMKRKTEVVDQTTKGIDYLMAKNKVTRYEGIGSFKDKKVVEVKESKKTIELTADHIMIATGSDVATLPFLPIDGKRIISSTEALELKEVPKELIIVGGGVIGVEIGSVYARLGSKVTVVEFLSQLIPTMDKELGKSLERSLKKLGMVFHFNTKVTGAKKTKGGVNLTAENQSGKEITVKGAAVLVSIGRRPYTDNLGLEKAGVEVDERGFIKINNMSNRYQTTAENIYAIGDVVEGPMLAHKASEEAVVCVEQINGQKPKLNYNCIPGVVYTWPEVAGVGYTEEQLKEEGRSYKTGKFPFKASGRARASNEIEGFIKVLSDDRTDEILGVHMIGPRVSDMIGEAIVAMEYRATAEDLAMMTHAHPSFSEAIKEAALDATEKRALHI